MAAAVEPALGFRVFGDVGQPGDIGSRGTEVAVHQIVVNGRSGGLPAAPPALLRGGGPDPVLTAQAMDPPFAHLVAPWFELIGNEAVAELGIVEMDVDDGVGQVRIVEVPIADGGGLPLVEGLGGEAEHPAGHRHRDPLGGELLDQRVHHFGSVSLAKYRRPAGGSRFPSRAGGFGVAAGPLPTARPTLRPSLIPSSMSD